MPSNYHLHCLLMHSSMSDRTCLCLTWVCMCCCGVPAGTYNDALIKNASAACKPCPTGRTTAAPGADQLDDCQCKWACVFRAACFVNDVQSAAESIDKNADDHRE